MPTLIIIGLLFDALIKLHMFRGTQYTLNSKRIGVLLASYILFELSAISFSAMLYSNGSD